MNLINLSTDELIELQRNLTQLQADSEACLDVLCAVSQDAYDAAFSILNPPPPEREDALRRAWYSASDECDAARESLQKVAAHLRDVESELGRRAATTVSA